MCPHSTSTGLPYGRATPMQDAYMTLLLDAYGNTTHWSVAPCSLLEVGSLPLSLSLSLMQGTRQMAFSPVLEALGSRAPTPPAFPPRGMSKWRSALQRLILGRRLAAELHMSPSPSTTPRQSGSTSRGSGAASRRKTCLTSRCDSLVCWSAFPITPSRHVLVTLAGLAQRPASRSHAFVGSDGRENPDLDVLQ